MWFLGWSAYRDRGPELLGRTVYANIRVALNPSARGLIRWPARTQ